MGLREDKQRQQRSEILENAFAYMREHAGELPTVAELARSCGVSDATVFNYVGQRDALLSEWAHRSLSDCCTAVADAGEGSLRRALRRASLQLRDQLAERPQVWLRVFAGAATVDPSIGRPGGARPGEEDPGLVRLVRVAQQRGEVRGDVAAEVQARALASAWLGALAREARLARLSETSDTAVLDAEAWQRVAATIELVLDGLRKRNERVRVAPAAGLHAGPGAVR